MEWVLLFGLPLVVSQTGSPEIAKVIVFEIGVGLLWLIGVWRGRGSVKWGQLLPLITLLGYVLLRGGELFGNGFRLQGIVLQLVALGFGIWTAIYGKNGPTKRLVWVSMALLFLGIVFFEENAASRAIGTLGEPNALGAVFVFSWPFVGVWGLVPALFASILARSRSALVAISIQVVMLVLLRRIKKLGVVVGLGLLLLTFAFGLPYFDQNRIWESRTQVWETAFRAGLARPVVGWGFGNIELAISTTAKELGNTVSYQRVDSAHNIFLDYWIQGGIVGLVLWLWVVSWGLRGLVKKEKKVETIALVGLLVTMSFNPSSVVTLMQFWWLIGHGMI